MIMVSNLPTFKTKDEIVFYRLTPGAGALSDTDKMAAQSLSSKHLGSS